MMFDHWISRWFILLWLGCCSPIFAEEDQSIKATLVAEHQTLQANTPFWVAIRLELPKECHIYWKNAGDAGMPTQFEWNLPPGFSVLEVKWPTPQRFTADSMVSFGYEEEATFLAHIQPPKELSSSEVELAVNVKWLGCTSSSCTPGEADLSIKLPVNTETKTNDEHLLLFADAREQIPTPLEEENLISMADPETVLTPAPPPVHQGFDGGLLLALSFAFLGGAILNLMPCVLPVISLKIFSFVKMAGQNRKLTIQHGVMFSIGVLISFWLLAALLLILKAYGQKVGWGFQLQEPLFVAFLASLLIVLSLGLFGLFETGNLISATAGKIQSMQSTEKGLRNSFLSGILATLLATPCTGPFLGSVLGFAVTAPASEGFLIFTAIGVGMATPYLILSIWPSLLRFLPKPGPWMVTFKQIMGFLMLATVLWLTWVYAAQTGSFAVLLLLGSFFLLAIASWIYGKWGMQVYSKRSRALSVPVSLLCAGLAVYMILVSNSTQLADIQNQASTDQHIVAGWEPFSIERVTHLREQGVPVLVDFTAKWCLICQLNHMVLSSEKVESKLSDLGVIKMKADWTKNDPKITEELRKHGRNGVPLYLLYTDKTTDPQILPQVLTVDTLLEYLN